jgi:hypothetical protein
MQTVSAKDAYPQQDHAAKAAAQRSEAEAVRRSATTTQTT